jgi:hypothetical protein
MDVGALTRLRTALAEKQATEKAAKRKADDAKQTKGSRT